MGVAFGPFSYIARAMSRKPRSNAIDYEDPEVWKECFEIFDRDRDGKLNMVELAQFIRALGRNPLNSEMEALVKSLGGENTTVDFNKAKSTLQSCKFKKPIDQERDMREAFKALDKDGRGTILEDELRQILCNLGENLEPYEVDQLIKNVKVNSWVRSTTTSLWTSWSATEHRFLYNMHKKKDCSEKWKKKKTGGKKGKKKKKKKKKK